MNKITIRHLLSSPIAFHPIFGRITGSVASGVFLSQIVYWNGQTINEDRWFYKPFEDWNRETCLTRREWETARKTLVSMKIIECKRKGLDPLLWYRLNTENLIKSIESYGKKSYESLNYLENAKSLIID
jgi:hypothetical protein